MNASITSGEVRTVGQEDQLGRVLEDSGKRAKTLLLKKFNPDKEAMDRLLGEGDEIINAIVDAFLGKAKEIITPNQYADEEVKAAYGYPREFKVKDLDQQIKLLRKHLPHLDDKLVREFVKNELPKLELPDGADGWFAVARWDKLGETYNAALEKLIETIAATRNLYNYREGETGPEYLKQSARSLRFMEKILEIQKGDILILPLQLGLRHGGRSVRRARECFTPDEFGAGAFMIGCVALTHPERYVRWEELDTDCPGDEYYPGAGGGPSRAPLWRFRGSVLRFGTGGVSCAYRRYGSASAFLALQK